MSVICNPEAVVMVFPAGCAAAGVKKTPGDMNTEVKARARDNAKAGRRKAGRMVRIVNVPLLRTDLYRNNRRASIIIPDHSLRHAGIGATRPQRKGTP
jgi:hypothetical protein